jgi:hypothetical protein
MFHAAVALNFVVLNIHEGFISFDLIKTLLKLDVKATK